MISVPPFMHILVAHASTSVVTMLVSVVSSPDDWFSAVAELVLKLNVSKKTSEEVNSSETFSSKLTEMWSNIYLK